MTEAEKRFYKTESGYRAIKNWYDSLLGKLSFEHELMYIDTRYGKTHILKAGDGNAEPLILVQGIACSAPLWYQQMPYFSKYFKVFALDTPGQPGRSDLNPPSFIEDGYTKWLLDVLDALKFEKAHFIGVSTAGWFVTKLAIHAPERINKMVLISPTGFVRARFPFKILIKNIWNRKKPADKLEDELSTRAYLPSKSTRKFDREIARAMALSTRHYRLDRAMGFAHEKRKGISVAKGLRVLRKIFLPEPMHVLKKIKTKGLVVLGDQELLFSSNKAYKKIDKHFPTLQVEIIPDSGHSLMYDKPAEFNKMAVDFLLSSD